jgi:hypothetical protein
LEADETMPPFLYPASLYAGSLSPFDFLNLDNGSGRLKLTGDNFAVDFLSGKALYNQPI